MAQKYKISKDDEKWLRAEAKKLPPDTTQTFIERQMTGEQVALSGYGGQLINGEPIDRKAFYTIKVPNIVQVNHTRQLLKKFAEGGGDAVHKYLDKYRTPDTKLFPAAPVAPAKPRKKTLFQWFREKFLK